MSGPSSGLPADGGSDPNWQWDGEHWQPVPPAEHDPAGAPADGSQEAQWVWDGTQWQPAAG